MAYLPSLFLVEFTGQLICRATGQWSFTFLAPATFALLPEIIEKDLLVPSAGVFSATQQVIGFVGSTLAGTVMALVGIVGAVFADAFSFVFAALAIGLTPLPTATVPDSEKQRTSTWRAFWDGWQMIKEQPIIKALIWLSACANVISFMGPLIPALVHLRLHGGGCSIRFFGCGGGHW